MLDDYAEKVLGVYQKKKASGTLSPNLSSPTPARLRDELLMVITERYKPGDERLLRSIFSPKQDIDAYRKVIKKETEKFRPLNYFLRGKTTDPDERVIDLLAWLIDIEPRPIIVSYLVNTEKKPEVGSSPEGQETSVKGKKNEKEHYGSSPANARKIMIALAASFVVIVGTYLVVNRLIPKVIQPSAHRNGKYMYWVGDHYLAVPSWQTHGDTPVVPLDSPTFSRLRKISNLKGINYSLIGKVWYARLHKDDYEYFTDSGFHPVDTEIRLRPITKFIIDNHILNRKAKQDSLK